MILYFIRHGESEANTLGIISNRNRPHALTETGRRQVLLLAEKLRTKSISRIYTSPIPRARETAEILAARLSLPMECVDALREPDCGILEGRGDKAAWIEHDFWKNSWLQGHERDRGPEGGETFNDVQKRFSEFIEYLMGRHGETEVETGLLLVTHGELIQLVLPRLCSNPGGKFILEQGFGYSVPIIIESQNCEFSCLKWEENICSAERRRNE
jgi:probable phosphoglycerate mutase